MEHLDCTLLDFEDEARKLRAERTDPIMILFLVLTLQLVVVLFVCVVLIFKAF